MRSTFLRRSVATSSRMWAGESRRRCGRSPASITLELELGDGLAQTKWVGPPMVAILIENNMQVYVIGGDGTHRGAAKLYEVGRTRRVSHAMVASEDGVVRSTAV